jgi:plastocyanin
VSENTNAPRVSSTASGKSVTIALVAENILFDQNQITVPAGSRVTINFDNRDAGVPHNIAVHKNQAASESVFIGNIITGPAKTTYDFTAPSKPGKYFFRCDVHPMMMYGDFVVQ